MSEFYNKYREALDLDCNCNNKPKQPQNKNCGCGGVNMDSNDNTIKILIKQLKRQVKELMQTTQAKLLCQDKKIAECCTYIKNNLSNYLRDLFDSMLESGEIEQIIKDIILDNVSTLQNQITNLDERTTELEKNQVNLYNDLDSRISANNTKILDINNRVKKIETTKPKMVVIGDSWSIENYPYIDNVEYMWQHIVAKQLNLDLKNYAQSGAGFTVANNLFYTQLNNAIADDTLDPNEVKYIFIFGGINDLDLGTPSAIKTNCNLLINQAKDYFTKSQIVLIGCNTQVKFKVGTNNADYNTMDITNILQDVAYYQGITFIDAQPFLYGFTDTINQYAHPSIEGLKGIANGILSNLSATYTRKANNNGNASYNLTSESNDAPSFIIQSSCKNNTLKLLFFINNIVAKSSIQNYIYNIPELSLPYMNAEQLKNLTDGKQHGAIKVTSDDSNLVRISIDANYSGSLFYETTIEI